MKRLFPTVNCVVYRETNPAWHIPMRTIGDHELVFVAEGAGHIQIGDRTVLISENDLVYFRPNQPHSLWVSTPPYMKLFCVHFSFSPQDECDSLPLGDITRLQSFYRLKELLKKLVQISTKKDYLHAWSQDVLFSQILLTLFGELQGEVSPSGYVGISAAIRHIHSNPFAQLDIQTLCSIAKMGKTNFFRTFKEVTGYSPIRYLLLLRLELSKNMLLSSALDIRQIAFDCGFSDECYYSRLFKKVYGISPGSFRKAHIHF